MVDVIMLAIMCAFFALAVAFVKACEYIIGPDTAVSPVDTEIEAEPERRGMSGIESVIGLVLSGLAIAYLLYALVFPEKL